MSEQFTPTTDDIRGALEAWIWQARAWRPELENVDAAEALDLWIGHIQRKASTEAFEKGRAIERALNQERLG